MRLVSVLWFLLVGSIRQQILVIWGCSFSISKDLRVLVSHLNFHTEDFWKIFGEGDGRMETEDKPRGWLVNVLNRLVKYKLDDLMIWHLLMSDIVTDFLKLLLTEVFWNFSHWGKFKTLESLAFLFFTEDNASFDFPLNNESNYFV